MFGIVCEHLLTSLRYFQIRTLTLLLLLVMVVVVVVEEEEIIKSVDTDSLVLLIKVSFDAFCGFNWH